MEKENKPHNMDMGSRGVTRPVMDMEEEDRTPITYITIR